MQHDDFSDNAQPTVTNPERMTAPTAPLDWTSEGLEIEGYELLERVGQGGFGRVYRARQTSLNRIVAIKVLSPALAADPDFRRRFVQEGQALALLDHPNIVRVIEIGQTERDIWMVMEFVEGESLHRRLKRGMDVDEVREVLAQVCSGLEAAHANNIVHRDIKPSNILIGSDGRVRVVDFGLAKLDESSLLTGSGNGMGTPGYIAPEQYRDARSVDWRADIFSLGAMSYQLLTTHIPTAGAPPPSSLNPSVPRAVDKVVFQAMQLEPASRPQGATEFLEQFSNAFNARSRPRFGRWLALAGLLLAGGVGVAFAVLAPPNLSDGLVLHYDFDEVDNGVVFDRSGNGHHGATFGNAAFEADSDGGQTLRINDSTSFVQAAYPTLETTQMKGHSFSVWVKIESYTTYSTVLFRGLEKEPGNAWAMQLGGGSGERLGGAAWGHQQVGTLWGHKAILRPEQLSMTATPLALETWHHFAGTFGKDGVGFYINGVKDPALPTPLDSLKDSPDSVFCIGKCRTTRDDWDDSFLHGWVDDVRLYDRALSEDEVRLLFEQRR